MSRPDDPTTPVDPARSGRPPRRIGPYLIQREIATGGMGTVYEALQENPRRPVAVKVLRQGMDSPEAVRRFEYESQILARLRHPGIAQVYEAGTHREGDAVVPYFAMEYISGAKSLTDYARDKHLDVRARLALFAEVCDAVHHGHQKGVVHRDLKPSNILVDSSGHPRVIDFGVARATDSDIVLATVATQVGQLLGSVRYMSPEQFDADPHDLDTRSDVYTLGVILYELLAGEAPLDLSTATVYEAARRVKEDAPARLGTKNPQLRGDLETIAHTALDKDRDRRYQSAHGLAADIRRYLAGEAISARRPSVAYQMRVFARRNRALTAALATVFVLLVGGIAATTWLYLHAEDLRTDAVRNADRAETANAFLIDMIREAIPMTFGDSPATVADLIDMSKDRLPEVFPEDEPEAQAEVCRTLGFGYLNLTRPQESYELLQRAYELRRNSLGPNHPATLESMEDVALLLLILGRFDESAIMREAIHSRLVEREGSDDPVTLAGAYELATTLARADRIEEAARRTEDIIATARRTLGPSAELTLHAEIFLAGLRMEQGKFGESETASRGLLDRCREAFGEEHRVTRTARSQYAATLVAQGRTAPAADLYRHRRVPGDPGIVQEFQGSFPTTPKPAEMLVFWESWCPFSQRAVPGMEPYYQRYRDQGLEIVGLCRVDRSATSETVRAFIDEHHLSFPVLKTDGRMNEYFGQPGTPFVVLLRDGEVVWESYLDTPETIPVALLEGLVADTGS